MSADGTSKPKGDERRPARHYRVGELIVVMASFAFTALILEPDGLLTWAQRMPVGRARSAWVAVLEPVDHAFDSRGIPRPRQTVIALGDRLQRVLEAPLGDAENDAPDDAPEMPAQTALAAPDDPADPVWPGLGLAMGYPAPGLEGDGGSPEDLSPDGGPGEAREALANASFEAAPAIADGGASASANANAVTTVLLVGDSMMKTGLSGAIKRSLGDDPSIRIVRANQEATGLSRPDVFDWAAVLRPLIDQEHPGLVVCTFGANDAQTIRENGQELEFATNDWDVAYRHRAVEMMSLLGHEGAEVLWLGLPTMRASEFDGRMKHLNGIFEQLARGVPRTQFLESASPVACGDEAYCTYQRQGRRLVKIRLDDGIHYTPAGGDLIARRIVDWIRQKNHPTTASLGP